MRSAFRYHNIWPSCVQAIARGSMVGVDVTHVLPTPHRIGGDIPQNVQLRRLRTTIATTACGDSVSNTRVRVKLAAAAPTQRRRRPLADEYKCKEQGRDHTRAYGNARRVSRHSLRPHLEPASSRLPLNRFKSLKSKLINVMKILQRGAKYCNVASNLKLSEQNRF